MRNILIVAALASGFIGSIQYGYAADSACKGLEQATCTANTACQWREALEAGKTMTKAGTPAKVNRKAHCAKARAQSTAEAAKQ